ncbi:hypothetical protein K435DRAFT_717104 [Dendrothele bispora CBS 962.96]|uniref:SEC7 domain-containing protein n=1 Tax=Dendrothele bispora (strain CBS 962.96) TaxID=1314807 RepID=A0A4S8MI02_DENBC|nr:hypothetical protein K435DRAFT_717104 [Dendrothele bispora CBS 962.96]
MESGQPSASDQREQRLAAVAKLKRAASLPRLKDGRRPPMHTEAVSEGEKVPTDDEPMPGDDTPPLLDDHIKAIEDPAETEADNEDTPVNTTPTRPKRRSRSRSRSRGSRDLKGKGRALQSPTPSPLIPGDSSQDEALTSDPTINLPSVPPIMSPTPYHIPQSHLLGSTTPTMQDQPFFLHPGTSPSTPLPSLEALQKGLFRSNSAGRMMAMHKLTGGTETYDPSLSPSPTPPVAGKFRRTNTVSGGERNAARKLLMDTLGGRSRLNRDTDGEQGSGNDEIQAPSPSPTPKRRRRRSRRGSSTTPNPPGTDSEFQSTTPNTPVVPPTPLPLFDQARSATPNYPPSSRGPTPNPVLLSRGHTPSPIPLSRGPTPNPVLPSRRSSPRHSPHDSPQPPPSIIERDRPEPTRRRSVVVEEEEEDITHPPLPSTPPKQFFSNGFIPRIPHSSDAPSDMFTDYTNASGLYDNQREEESFPSSPFSAIVKDQSPRDEDEVLYTADTSLDRSIYDNEISREISWIAEPVPEIRMPIHDEDEEDDEEDEEEPVYHYGERPVSTRSSNDFAPGDAFDDMSPRASSDSQHVIIESEASPETHPYVPPSPSSVAALSQSAFGQRRSDGSMSQFYPQRLSVASRLQGDRSPFGTELMEMDDKALNDNSSKRSGDSTSTSAWEKVKNTFKSGSSNGRRSRSNSIVNRDRRDHVESSISRESGASLNNSRFDQGQQGSAFTTPQSQYHVLSPSASAQSLTPPNNRGGVSPVPPPSSADLAKYQSSKLFPFPGMKLLEEERERNRAKGILPASASTPDVSTLLNVSEDGPFPLQQSSSNGSAAEWGRDRPPLMQQASDSNLVGKYINTPSLYPATSSSPLSPSHPEYFDIQPPSSGNNSRLPMTLPGVKQWLSKNKEKLFSSSPVVSPTSPNEPMRNGQNGMKKPSLSDLLRRKENELVSDWDESSSTPTESSILNGKSQSSEHVKEQFMTPTTPPPLTSVSSSSRSFNLSDNERTPKASRVGSIPLKSVSSSDSSSQLPMSDVTSTLPSPPDVASSTTPDPSSSLSDYPAHTTSDSSSSSTSSRYSGEHPGLQGPVVLERLEENLTRGSRSPMWAAAIEEPPRKVILSSPVLQVVNANMVKDRFLFLFSDILVIAKPITQDDPTPERKFVVKSVVLLQHLRLSPDRNDGATSAVGSSGCSPMIRSFVHQFNKDPDQAITNLVSKAPINIDPSLLGDLLFRMVDLDRTRLGLYLSQRTSKLVLKSYVDSFRFVGLRIDKALRAFLLSVHVPMRSVNGHGALEYLLDSFSSRWYEANARLVTYDKDVAIRLVRAIMQLNDLLHDGIAQYPGAARPPRKNVSPRGFIDAFRRYDTRNSVHDDLLEDIYESILRERISHAKDSLKTSNPPDVLITIKRPLPVWITYKVQSEPVIFRIPQSDPNLSIQLYGQDLIFEPPVLTFAKSPEAAFRVMGTSLGTKTIIICRSGPNALKYSGLPLGQSITIERAFMRNTFQMAFLNHAGARRRYMFSVDDPLIRHQWIVSLKKHIEIAQTPSAHLSTSSIGDSNRFYRAAEVVAFKVLQETLVDPNVSRSTGSLVHHALERLNGPQSQVSRFGAFHARSKSRSQVYHQSSAGKDEPDSGVGSDEKLDSAHGDAPLWTGRELEMQCLQNSSIPLVLSYLQVGSPELSRNNS